jgi:hypothetical protein
VTEELNEEVLAMVDPLVLGYADPAARFCVGTRLYVHFALRYPVWGAFLTRIGPAHAVRGRRMDRYLLRDLEHGIASGRLNGGSALAVRDLVLGSVFFGIETMLTEGATTHHIEDMLYLVLHGLGLPADEARALAYLPLPPAGAASSPVFATLKTTLDN